MKNSPIGIKSIFMVVLGLTFLIPLNAFAKRPFYIAVKPGIYSPQTNDLDGFNTGFSGEVAFGYRLNPNIAAEIGFGYFNSEGEYRIGGATYVDREFNIHVYPVTFTLKAILPYKRWEFYGLGGAGAYIVYKPYDHDYYDYYNDYHHDHDYEYDTVFGGFLGAGVNYDITSRIFVGVEGKYLWTDKVKLEYGEFGTPLEVKFRLDGFIATAVIGFRF